MHGENHAKDVILTQSTAVQAKLSNGHKSDPATQGEGILLALQMLHPLFEACFVTEEVCEKRRADCPGAAKKMTKAHAGIFGGAGLGSVGAICYTILKLTGHIQ